MITKESVLTVSIVGIMLWEFFASTKGSALTVSKALNKLNSSEKKNDILFPFSLKMSSTLYNITG